MAHELATQMDGRAATAWVGLPPWHGLGQSMSGDETLDEWIVQSGLNWRANKHRLGFDAGNITDDIEFYGEARNPERLQIIPDIHALVRSDNGNFLGQVTNRYKVVQPIEVMKFFEDLTDQYGYKMETAGALKEGRVIWALASTGLETKLEDIDEVRAYLLLATSFDRSIATHAKFTSVRVVCNNTLTMAMGAKSASSVVIQHSKAFDAKQVKLDLKIGSAWAEFKTQMDQMVDTRIDEETQARFLLKLYHDRDPGDKLEMKDERTMVRMAKILRSAPGADMPTALGTVWGLLNAVTHDVDYDVGCRSADRRLASAWFSDGERLKNKAFSMAMDLVNA